MRRICNLFEMSGTLWKGEYKRSNKAFNAALISAECFQHLAGSSVLSSPDSRTCIAIHRRGDSKSNHTCTRRTKEPQKDEILEMELPVEVTRTITPFFDNTTNHAHLFAEEFHESTLVSLYRQIRCDPNETLSDIWEICGWIGVVPSDGKFQLVRHLGADNLSWSGALLRITRKNLDQTRTLWRTVSLEPSFRSVYLKKHNVDLFAFKL